jgi:hypothetical protein
MKEAKLGRGGARDEFGWPAGAHRPAHACPLPAWKIPHPAVRTFRNRKSIDPCGLAEPYY